MRLDWATVAEESGMQSLDPYLIRVAEDSEFSSGKGRTATPESHVIAWLMSAVDGFLTKTAKQEDYESHNVELREENKILEQRIKKLQERLDKIKTVVADG